MGPGTLKIPNTMFRDNRERVCSEISKKAGFQDTLLFFQGGNQEYRFDTDTGVTFLQESNFMWLFGVVEPNFYGAIVSETCQSLLFMPRLPKSYEVWLGALKSPDFFKQHYGVDFVYYSDEILGTLGQMNSSSLVVLNGTNGYGGRRFPMPHFDGMDKFNIRGDVLYDLVVDLRLIKSEIEISILRYVTRISGEAHNEVLKTLKPGDMEYMAEATFRYECYARGGMRHMGYTAICPSGEMTAVLHYGHAGEPNDREIMDGDLLLFDMGGEYAGYTTDITVSFPANGKFTDQQKFVYNTCLRANRAIIEQTMISGKLVNASDALGARIIMEEFVKEGLLNGTVDEMLAVGLGRVFLPHGLSHHIGLDVHDVEDLLRTTKLLQVGMVVTVEPGVYFGDQLIENAYDNEEQSKFMVREVIEPYRGMGGVRIEDVVVITAEKAELLSNNIPRTVEEIENCMKD